MPIILIDSGTTNSRIRLVDEEQDQVRDTLKLEVGVRYTAIDGNNNRLKQELASGLQALLERNELSPEQIKYIVAAGMITSNLGIYEVPHVTAPARLIDFVQNSKIVKSEDFFQIPCMFVPGMKNDADNMLEDDITAINNYDVMRGEEVETYGLLKQLAPKGKGLMVLPGSHTKFVLVDKNQTLLSCLSTLGGEMLKAVRDQTIISDSLGEKLIETVLPEKLIEGYRAAQKVGVTRSFYHIRLLHLFSTLTVNERANYYAGTVLYYDIDALMQSLEKETELAWIIVGGSDPLRTAFFHLLKHVNEDWKIIEASDDQVELATVYGAGAVGMDYYANKQ